MTTQQDVPVDKKAFKPGNRVIISDNNHPWYGESGTLESYGAYGLAILNLQGWLINLDIGHRTYAKGKQIRA